MQERKKPGPHTDKPLEHHLKVRVDNDTLAEIDFCKEKLQITCSEVLRKGIHTLYCELKK